MATCIPVSTIPGATAIALMFLFFDSAAKQRVHMSKPAFDTQYADHDSTGLNEAPLEIVVTRD